MPAFRAAPLLLALLSVGAFWAPVLAARHPAALHARARGLLQNGPEDEPERSIQFQWNTDPAITLTYQGVSFSHGDLCNSGPFTDIPAGSSGYSSGCVEDDGWLTGVQGTATYSMSVQGGASGCTLSLSFDNPYLGSNSYSCSASGPSGCSSMQCSVTNGGGDNANPTVTVSP